MQTNPGGATISPKEQKIYAQIEELQKQEEALTASLYHLTSAEERYQTEKQIAKLQKKISQLRIRITPKEMRSVTDNLYTKTKLYRNLIICLLVVLFLVTAVCVMIALNKKDLENHYSNSQGTIHSLQQQIVQLQEENGQLSSELSAAISDYDDLLENYGDVGAKAEWFDEYARIVVADEGPYYYTYHTYDCDIWENYSFWIHNIDWVSNGSEYIECSQCH